MIYEIDSFNKDYARIEIVSTPNRKSNTPIYAVTARIEISLPTIPPHPQVKFKYLAS